MVNSKKWRSSLGPASFKGFAEVVQGAGSKITQRDALDHQLMRFPARDCASGVSNFTLIAYLAWLAIAQNCFFRGLHQCRRRKPHGPIGLDLSEP
jgi:hypothetical protein